MRVVIQRVKSAKVIIDNNIYSSIEKGMLIFLAIEDTDSQEDIDYLVKKILLLRIFDDKDGVMNLNINQIEGQLLLVSQFTLFASTRKGNRPSYLRSSKPEISKPMYEKFINSLQTSFGKPIATGIFGADMLIDIQNQGPVTIIIDSKLRE